MASTDKLPITQALLARAHPPDAAARIFADKIQRRPIFLRPTSPPPHLDAREARRRARQKKANDRRKTLRPAPLSARQRRRLGLYEVPREGRKYATFEPLHRLWLGYVREVLGGELLTGGQGAAAKLSSADMHGAEMEVVRSRCVDRVGIRGIVVKDARFVFEVITREDKLKIVPKEGTVFRVEVPVEEADGAAGGSSETGQNGDGKKKVGQVMDVDKQAAAPAATPRRLVFEIHGDQFSHRAADRANKKFKAHFLKDL
ncbi:Ribonuclease P protein subunit [Pleurostoma richardsiae]|uniref:Ribonuclease P protein subunit n=1 Tax=Pleurostoma richardsiae TaxID=41990 RepID=A0AA38RDC9_9PEZI|nr:Ribonuclease P protein subunit [Pleurostoma richardsiae]